MHNLHIIYVFNLLELHILNFIYNLKGIKMIQNIIHFFDSTYKAINGYSFDNVDPQLVRYFRTEYGQDWKSALTEHLYKKESNNDKKAA
tara:strand:- start:267 stop:533 length:267 start_codon:yes stop_codon:yes gene_type:complete